MIVIGERLNSSRPAVRDALLGRDRAFIADQALLQVRAGADYLDLNAAGLLDKEKDALRWAIPVIQKAVDVSLSLDTPDSEAMRAALQVHRGRALLNSLTGEEKSLRKLLPIIQDHKPRVIVLCLDDDGAATTPERAVSIAQRVAGVLIDRGLDPRDIFIDPLLRPLATDRDSAVQFLASLRSIRKCMPGVRTVAGLSNLSYGLPRRRLLNRTMLVLAVEAGLGAAICDPLDSDLRAAMAASEALLIPDQSLGGFLRFFWEKKGEKTVRRS